MIVRMMRIEMPARTHIAKPTRTSVMLPRFAARSAISIGIQLTIMMAILTVGSVRSGTGTVCGGQSTFAVRR